MDSDEEWVPPSRNRTAGARERLEAEADFNINVIGASSDEEEEVFVRNRLSTVQQNNVPRSGSGDAASVVKPADVQAESVGDSHLPIDRGWAWIILAGCFLNVVIMIGYGRGLAILFVEYLALFEASTTKTTLLMGVMAGVYSLSSLISMHVLVDLLGVRKTVMLGATLTVAAMVMAIFPTSITYMICTHSVFIGVGHSMIYGPALVLIGHYFNKRRGLATAIAMCGISFGSSVFPPLIRHLLDEYGLRGSMIILTGITMNMWVGGIVNRPLESYKRKDKNEIIKPNAKRKRHLSDTKLNRRSFGVDFKQIGQLNPEKFLSASSITSELMGRSPLQGYSLFRTDLPDSPSLTRRISRPLSATSQTSYSMYASNVELGSVPLLNVEPDEEAPSAVDGNMYGMFASSYFCLIPVAIVDLLGLPNMAKTLGFVSLFHGVSMAVTHPIVGSLTDSTGSYTAGFNYLGACAYTSAIILLFVPVLTRRAASHLQEETLKDEVETKPLQETTEL
ncbi:monocarboxylate transporter 12-like isoform X2 [Haliotis asinina]|uniref:monocarboxylate transporter 12-like isoform X2 n=1 Tax=Haliotis asinina TaxID=109174 RepID=UPI003531C9DA